MLGFKHGKIMIVLVLIRPMYRAYAKRMKQVPDSLICSHKTHLIDFELLEDLSMVALHVEH